MQLSILAAVNPVSDWPWLCVLDLGDLRMILTVFMEPAAKRSAGKTDLVGLRDECFNSFCPIRRFAKWHWKNGTITGVVRPFLTSGY